MIAVGKAEASSNLDRLLLLDWLNWGGVHKSQAADGLVRICLTSLLRCFEPAEAQRVFRWFEERLGEIRRKP